MERNGINFDKESSIEWPSGEADTNYDVDKLPFKV